MSWFRISCQRDVLIVSHNQSLLIFPFLWPCLRCVHLVAELSFVKAAQAEVAKLLPVMSEACRVRHYTHHFAFLESVCKVVSSRIWVSFLLWFNWVCVCVCVCVCVRACGRAGRRACVRAGVCARDQQQYRF